MISHGAELKSWANQKIAQLEAENERQRGVIEMLMERCRWLQEEGGGLYAALESVQIMPRPREIGFSIGLYECPSCHATTAFPANNVFNHTLECLLQAALKEVG